jgi:NADPH-dependent glutamate synthase beta subunit-like oxidoreductase
VIGGGPAGLTNAYFLRRLGHAVTIFDMMPKLGGMIRYGIPEYRLPKEVLEWEIEGILNLGIAHRPNVKLGHDFTLADLETEGFDAVFMGIGAWRDYSLKVEGEDLEGCYTGIDFLTKFALNQQAEQPAHKIGIGRKCAVIGGGNTAIDCVRTLVRLGAEEVSIVYRRTRKEMPANEVEIVAAEHEGVKFHFLAAPTRIIGDESGRATHLEFLKMELGEPDASGRRRPIPIEGSEFEMNCDLVIIAVGANANPLLTRSTEGLKLNQWGYIVADETTGKTSKKGVWAGGDIVTGSATVILAMGAGRAAAESIHQYLQWGW